MLVDEHGWRLHYSHWAAAHLHRYLLPGPAAACEFVAAQMETDEWLDDVWGEGGALIDMVRRRLVWFGNLDGLAFRRAVHRLLRETWPGWSVEWAHGGLGDIAAAVGVPRAAVGSPEPLDSATLSLAEPGGAQVEPNEQGFDDLVTVSRSDGLRVWVLDGVDVDEHPAARGPGLLDALPGPGARGASLPAQPARGLHVDPAARTIWAGWSVDFRGDRYEDHLTLTSGAVTVPPEDPTAALDTVVSSLARPTGFDRAGLDDLAAGLTEGDPSAQLNPMFHRHIEPVPVDRSALAAAIIQLR